MLGGGLGVISCAMFGHRGIAERLVGVELAMRSGGSPSSTDRYLATLITVGLLNAIPLPVGTGSRCEPARVRSGAGGGRLAWVCP
jgi:hypothetical protein